MRTELWFRMWQKHSERWSGRDERRTTRQAVLKLSQKHRDSVHCDLCIWFKVPVTTCFKREDTCGGSEAELLLDPVPQPSLLQSLPGDSWSYMKANLTAKKPWRHSGLCKPRGSVATTRPKCHSADVSGDSTWTLSLAISGYLLVHVTARFSVPASSQNKSGQEEVK